MARNWYDIDDVDELDSPALVLFKERVIHNIALAISMVGVAARLRPHAKTHKSPDVTRLMLSAGITKFKCATIAEAEMLAQCGARDVLLAYQPVGPKIKRLLKLVERFPSSHFSCLVDAKESAAAIAAQAVEAALSIDVFLDVNVGMNRTGVMPGDALSLYEACAGMRGIRVIGLHGYDGHINDADLAMRRQRADEVYGVLKELKEALVGRGLEHVVIVVGGSPTFGMHCKREDVECSPGTFVYWDWSYQSSLPDLPFLPAAMLVSRVVSVVDQHRICVDLGHKSVAAENPLERRVHFVNAEGLHPVGQSEEHLVMETAAPGQYKVGDVLYGMPFHVCPTVALYEQAYVVEDGKVVGTWKMTARDRRIFI